MRQSDTDNMAKYGEQLIGLNKYDKVKERLMGKLMYVLIECVVTLERML